ncbi:MAG TPA: hypothetical protein DD473_19610 [Planctomycetaceae bacterium]|nr:hypothetical protein [Planctomycetaceae bacterium]
MTDHDLPIHGQRFSPTWGNAVGQRLLFSQIADRKGNARSVCDSDFEFANSCRDREKRPLILIQDRET